MSRLANPVWFLAAYCPLFGLLALRSAVESHWIPAAGLAILTIMPILTCVCGIRTASRGQALAEVVVSWEDAAGDAGLYVITLVVPLLLVPISEWLDWVTVGIVLMVTYLLAGGDNLVPNPLLRLFGYRLIRVRRKEGADQIVIIPRGYPLEDRLYPPVPIGHDPMPATLDLIRVTARVSIARKPVHWVASA